MIIKADRQIFSFPEVRSFTVIGDPGCDGLGSENLDVFVSALSAAGGDMIFLLGDVVPYGTERFYQRLAKVIPLGSDKPVMSVRGNHDKEGFDGVFGMGDYAVV
ncbi:MAG: metallophosphoesterase, partial [Planctomycetes bacterium]|nr:metallophosphoesterase [Planctomycetota bacterium]